MSTSRLSRTVVVAALVALVVAGTALAVTVAQEDVPSEATVGDPAAATVNITDLYDEESEWTLTVETQLKNPDWTIRYYDQTGEEVKNVTRSGPQEISGSGISSPIDTVSIKVTGEVPAVESYTYPGKNTFTILEILQGNDVIKEYSTVHFTSASRDARQALNAAQGALDRANASGAAVSGALSDYNSAVQAYEGENFQLASNLASKAETKANDAREAAQSDEDSGGLPVAVIGGGVVVLLLVVGGGFYYYRQNQQQGTKLR